MSFDARYQVQVDGTHTERKEKYQESREKKRDEKILNGMLSQVLQ